RVIFAICVVCFALAIYSGHRIVSETHLPPIYEPSPVPGVSRGLHRDSIATLEQAQRIRASRLAAAANRPSSPLQPSLVPWPGISACASAHDIGKSENVRMRKTRRRSEHRLVFTVTPGEA